MSDNKALWQRVCVTDPKAVKPITGKQYSGNSPKPYWIVERLTDEFGPCGIGWGFTIINERFERFSESDTLHVAAVRLWYVLDGKRGELEQIGQTKASYTTAAGKFMLDEDAPKKSVTDALVKCASYLGFAGDIFSGRWDDSKYIAWAAQETAKRTQSDAGGVISAPRESLQSLPPDWQAWLKDFAPEVENTFEGHGPQAAQDLINSNKLDNEVIAGLYALLGSKTRAGLKALTQKKAA